MGMIPVSFLGTVLVRLVFCGVNSVPFCSSACIGG